MYTPPQRTTRCNPRPPSDTDPFSIDSVALQDNWKTYYADRMAASMKLQANLDYTRPDNGTRSIEFYSLAGSIPHYFYGISWAGNTAPEACR